MTRSVRRRAGVALVTPLLLVGSAFAVTLGGEAVADSSPDVGSLPTLSPDDRSRALPRAASPGVLPLVTPQECLTVTGDHVTVLRYAGDNRYQTAVCASFWTWDDYDAPRGSLRAQAVVLARGDEFADALAGGPLAGYAEGPLLLTRPTALPAIVLEEIQRVLPPGGLVYLLGSPAAISGAIESQLESEGFTTRRLAGERRIDTALAIAEELPDTSNFFFASVGSFLDALAAAAAAAALSRDAKLDEDPETRPFAVLLTADEDMPTQVVDLVIARAAQFGVSTLATVGIFADHAAGELPMEPAHRFIGVNRYERAAEIAETIYTDANGELVGTGAGLATGTDFPDALAATAALAPFAEPLLFTRPTQLPTPTRAFLQNHAGEGEFMDVFGGPPAVSDAVVDQAEAAFTLD